MERKDLRALVDGGVLLTSRALEAGWPRASLFRRLRSQGWARVQGGAWAEPGREIDLVVRLKAAQSVRRQLVVSHGSAARLWQIETLDGGRPAEDPRRPCPLEFTDPGLSARQGFAGVRVHRIPLLQVEVGERSGLRVTEVPRTLADLLRAGPRDNALVAVESALTYRRVGGARRAPLITPASLAVALEAPLLDAGRAQEWLVLLDPRSGSPAETIARLHMHDAGLRPETQVEVRTSDGRRRYLDFLFRAEGLAIEIEGYAYHGTRDAHRRDVARFNQLAQSPEVRILLRYTAEDVFHRPLQMIREIRAALNTGAALSGTGPAPRQG
ncbi:hypothetical protein ACQF36_42290 [Streptomyces sp. Marseille-Q5077]|uniref:hypothetical protein n=1 Tax=Streptomyces sp. Marseille-Q5077 TaxID=3418995 RepID=UPI003CFC5A87